MAEASAQTGSPFDPVSADLIACIRKGAAAVYDDACATLYRTREGVDEQQIRGWQDAEARAERHEALLNLLGLDDVDIAPSFDVTGTHAETVREALERYTRDFPDDPLRQEIKALRHAPGERTGLRKKLWR